MKNKWFGVEEKCLLRSKMASVKQLYNHCEIFHPFREKLTSEKKYLRAGDNVFSIQPTWRFLQTSIFNVQPYAQNNHNSIELLVKGMTHPAAPITKISLTL